MRSLLAMTMLASVALIANQEPPRSTTPAPAQDRVPTAEDGRQVIRLWPKIAPGSEEPVDSWLDQYVEWLRSQKVAK